MLASLAALDELADQTALASKGHSQSVEEIVADIALTLAGPSVICAGKYILKNAKLFK